MVYRGDSVEHAVVVGEVTRVRDPAVSCVDRDAAVPAGVAGEGDQDYSSRRAELGDRQGITSQRALGPAMATDLVQGGPRALCSASTARLGEAQFAGLEAEPARGPVAHGWRDQRWTLSRIKTVIGRGFHKTYTLPGVRTPLICHG
jgi:hypothetical protein